MTLSQNVPYGHILFKIKSVGGRTLQKAKLLTSCLQHLKIETYCSKGTVQ